uniref:Uncharacterized protein n=1 Tax=Arundo donax TaxID=35708 RepID=A0A0A9SFS9_ARUDO
MITTVLLTKAFSQSQSHNLSSQFLLLTKVCQEAQLS